MKLKGRHLDTFEVIEEEAGGAEQPHRTRLPGCILKVAEGDYFEGDDGQ
jgi:hypothetical protein